MPVLNWYNILRFGYAAVLCLTGAALLFGGAKLIAAGGSYYYLMAGGALLASGALIARRSVWGTRLYSIFLLATVVWAVWEAGFDGWALLPRLGLPLALAVPALARPLTGQSLSIRGAIILLGGGIAAIATGIAIRSIGPSDPPDPMFQAGVAPRVNASGQAGAFADPAPGEWLHYGGDRGGKRFSPLAQINTVTVKNLKPAWEYKLGQGPKNATVLEATPLKVGTSLYLCTGYGDVVSLDAESGRQLWRYRDTKGVAAAPAPICRGVAYYEVPGATGPCAQRILSTTKDARLFALDARTGLLCPEFGTHGQVSLLVGMGQVPPGYYFVTSAPTIIRGKVVLGGWISDGQYWGEPSGVIRAYDATTGHFAWAFDMGRPDDHGEPKPGREYTRATPNSWAPMSADEELGLVFAPTGNATPDYYAPQRRPFDDRFSSSVIALDAETGALKWSFQTVHHDVWDYDVASQPTLVDIRKPGGGMQRLLLQPTKRGEIFVLDRLTGRPLTQIEERPAPGGSVEGERLSPTQPFPVGFPSFRGPELREVDMWGVTMFDQLWCRIRFAAANYKGPFTPINRQPTVVYPGYLGGSNWGSIAVDPIRAVAIVNTNRVANIDQLIPRAEADRRGLKPAVGAAASHVNVTGAVPQAGTPYAADIRPFLSPIGAPCNKPPYGVIAAVDLDTHKLLWSRKLGTARDSGVLGVRLGLPLPRGVPNMGGALVTGSGLAFISATQERTLRALDVRSGRVLWQSRLPAGGHATPMTYWSDQSGRQFVVVVAGGHPLLDSKPGASVVAYALPRAR